jgi:hypothetical protein
MYRICRRVAARRRVNSRETIADRMFRNPQSRKTAFVWKLMPGQPRRQPGLLANLQAARATIFLIEHDDNHSDILGETTLEIKLLSWPAPFCR